MKKQATPTFSPSKIALFMVANVVGGLFQIWVLAVILSIDGEDHRIGVLLGDGGLFFFATSLTVNSFLIFEGSRRKHSAIERTFTLLAILLTIGMSVAVYAAVFTHQLGKVEPFHDHVVSQIALASLALIYAMFVAERTGYFSR
jgi:ABC-type phosphate transport system permease subunit